MADGIIIIDKPAGWTSMDVCGKLRGILKTKKVGHAGTLDPMATGVLPVFVGNATRAVSYAEGGDKEYVAGLRLGLTTNTQDTTGEVVAERPVSVTRAQLEDVLARFTGEIDQVPPMYSAIKINGQKLYQLARKGQEIERPPRRVTIHELALLEPEDGDWRLRIRCSKGTYVRALCHDIGQALGCGGCMASLRRTMAAGYTLAESHTIDEVQSQGEALLREGYRTYIIDDAELERVKRSYPVIWKDPAAAPQLCFVGCPHLTLEQLKDWTAKLTDALRAQNRLQVAVPTVFTAAPAVLDAFKDTVEGYKLQSMGVILSYICPLMYMNNPLCKKKAVITNSNKLRTYTSARYYTDAEILDILSGKEGR